MKALLTLARKDILIAFSYRMEFLLRFFGIFFSVVLWYFLARLVGDQHPGYFEFVIIGLAAQSFLGSHLHGTGSRIRDEQVTGTLESILATGTPPTALLAGGTIADFLNALISFTMMVSLAMAVGGFHLSVAPLSLLISLFLSAFTFAALGTLSACSVIFFQRGNPFNLFLSTMQALLGSVFFPIDLLPPWLQAVARWMPMTHALKVLRGSLLHGEPLSALAPSLLYLLIFSLLFYSAGSALFAHAIRRARKEGTLGRF